jgi:thiol-disulfide isomerase/thioredoxin
MKKQSTLAFFVVSFIMSSAQVRDFNISITVKGMENKIGILAYYYGDKRFVKDTLQFDSKGATSIKGKKDIAAGVYLLAFPSRQMSSFDMIIAEPAFSITTDTLDFVKHAVVKNSLENKEMFEDMNFMIPLGVLNDSLQKKIKPFKKGEPGFITVAAEIDGISKKITDHRKEMIKKYPATLYSKLLGLMLDLDIPPGPKKPDGSLVDTFYVFHYTQQHYFDKIDFSDSGLIRSPIFQSKLIRYLDDYTYPQPDSIIKTIDQIAARAKVNAEMFQFCVNEMFLKYAKSEIMGQDAIYVYMADNYYLNGKAWWVDPSNLTELRDRVEALKPTLIGNLAPNFIVQDSMGRTQVFHDFIPKNKYNLLVFWNSDCGHCQHEIPYLKRLYQDSLRTLGVRVFAVTTEQTDSSFRAFAAKNCAPDWITCADMRGVSAYRREYDVIATPKVFLITPDYRIVAKNIPLENLVDFIKFEDEMVDRKKRTVEER